MMNERIQELHQQAKDYINEVSDDYGTYQGKEYMEAVREKFAELIVRECMNVAQQQRNPANLNYKPSERFVEDLRQHFGVE